MTQVVYKYPLKIEDRQELSLPKGAKILRVDTQDGKPYIWALVETTKAAVTRRFVMVGIGHPIAEDAVALPLYLGTIFLHDKRRVFHVFEYEG